MRITWVDPPGRCDLCNAEIRGSFVDGQVRGRTSWAIMCEECFKVYGVGLGLGQGQEFKQNEEGLYQKVRG